MSKKLCIVPLLIAMGTLSLFGASTNKMSLPWDTDITWSSSDEAESARSAEGSGSSEEHDAGEIFFNPLFYQYIHSPPPVHTSEAASSTGFKPSLETGLLLELHESNLLHHYDSLQLLNCLKRTWIAQQAYLEYKVASVYSGDQASPHPLFGVRDKLIKKIKKYWYDTDIGKNNILSAQATAFMEYIIKSFEAFVESELIVRALAEHKYLKALRCATAELNFEQIFRGAIMHGYLEIAIMIYHKLQKEGISIVCRIPEPAATHEVIIGAWESWKERYPQKTRETIHHFWRLMNQLIHLCNREYYELLLKSNDIDERHWALLITRMIDGTYTDSDLPV